MLDPVRPEVPTPPHGSILQDQVNEHLQTSCIKVPVVLIQFGLYAPDDVLHITEEDVVSLRPNCQSLHVPLNERAK